MVGTRDKQSTPIMLTPLLTTQVSGWRERFRETFVRTIGVVDLRTPRLLLVHDAGVLELLNKRLLPPETEADLNTRFSKHLEARAY